MALKRIKVKTVATPKKPGEVVEVTVDGEVVRMYNRAADAAKAAEGVMAELRPEVLELGHGEVISRSIKDPTHPTLTVKMVDETGSALRVQFTKRYGKVADVDALDDLCEDYDVDINDHVQETTVGVFDSKAFLDANGEFDRKRYNAYLKAVKAVADQFDDDCPLSTEKVVAVKNGFHDRRWLAFPKEEAQLELLNLVPNTTQVVPVRDKKK